MVIYCRYHTIFIWVMWHAKFSFFQDRYISAAITFVRVIYVSHVRHSEKKVHPESLHVCFPFAFAFLP